MWRYTTRLVAMLTLILNITITIHGASTIFITRHDPLTHDSQWCNSNLGINFEITIIADRASTCCNTQHIDITFGVTGTIIRGITFNITATITLTITLSIDMIRTSIATMVRHIHIKSSTHCIGCCAHTIHNAIYHNNTCTHTLIRRTINLTLTHHTSIDINSANARNVASRHIITINITVASNVHRDITRNLTSAINRDRAISLGTTLTARIVLSRVIRMASPRGGHRSIGRITSLWILILLVMTSSISRVQLLVLTMLVSTLRSIAITTITSLTFDMTTARIVTLNSTSHINTNFIITQSLTHIAAIAISVYFEKTLTMNIDITNHNYVCH